MRVLIADKLTAYGKASLAKLGHELDDRPDLGADDLPQALAETGARVLVVRSTKVTAEAIAAAKGLGLVIRAGSGVNTIDIAAATAQGVAVANCPGQNSIAVAELTMGLIIALDRFIPDAVARLRQGEWLKKHFGKGRGLFGSRLGLVGFGAIAREVAQRAKAFGMEVHAFDVALTDEVAAEHGITRAASLQALLPEADVISIHVPYIKGSTHHLIGEAELGLMKEGASLVHTARGGVVDDAALLAAVKAGRIRAALDVYEDEPESSNAKWSTPLLDAGVYGTPHIGASTDQAGNAVADEVARIVRDFVAEGVVHNCVNPKT